MHLSRIIRRAGTALLQLILVITILPGGFAGHAVATPLFQPAPVVAVRAASGQTVTFKTQNGQPGGPIPAWERDIPHLVLYRNGSLADARERTLTVELTDIEVPPGGVTVTLTIETQNLAVDPSGPPSTNGRRIAVWQESRTISNPRQVTETLDTVRFAHRFAATTVVDGREIPTPTDYFRYEITVQDRLRPGAAPLHVLTRDHAFLMESQWIVPLPKVREEMPGAAPDELVVHYNDMFPIRQKAGDPSTWLEREEVPDYIQWELVPAMIEAFRVQANEWGLTWHQAWTSYRPEDGRRLSVALSDGETWYHGPAPTLGHAGISINLNGIFAEYDSVTDGAMSNFHHELFHNYQRGLNQHLGNEGRIAGSERAWEFFSEGTAVVASSVGQPEVQFTNTWGVRSYILHVRRFLGSERSAGGGLNRSYGEMAGYDASAYWRFLYEQCGGLTGEKEDPAAGMAVLRASLESLYKTDIVDIDTSTDLVASLPSVMDRALASTSCPFKTYEHSLLAFSRAIQALRLDGGRCTAPGSTDGCGLYDPEGLYHDPPANTILYAGEPLTYSAVEQAYPPGIPSSFGIDLLEIKLTPDTSGQPLALEFYGRPGAEARFAVQIWKVGPTGSIAGALPVAQVFSQGEEPTIVHLAGEGELTEHDRLDLTITRLDAQEGADGQGAYNIRLFGAGGVRAATGDRQ